MLSEIPIDLEKVSKEDRDREILRVGIIAELDAINLYEQLAAMAEREEVKKVLLDIAKEEKNTHGRIPDPAFKRRQGAGRGIGAW